ncbi:Hypothetical protein CINCED_3A022256 [Cinara cedri]|uniref:Uncharacterized protein n=1 Tax=Cinara cedri TaxID=506608 RepID=A0A5E4MG27_9HEMI|nr:Hypothetical protein CINCED_3A022256 [Cinara cedri]
MNAMHGYCVRHGKNKKTAKSKNIHTIKNYKITTSNIEKMLRFTKINLFKTTFNKVPSSPKLTWKLVREINEVNPPKEMKSVLVDNKVVGELHAVSNYFDLFFMGLGKNTLENNTKINNNAPKENISDLSFDDIFNVKITESKVSKIINNFKDVNSR